MTIYGHVTMLGPEIEGIDYFVPLHLLIFKCERLRTQNSELRHSFI